MSGIIELPEKCKSCERKEICPIVRLFGPGLGDLKGRGGRVIIDSLGSKFEQTLLEKISPEIILQHFGSAIFRLAQSWEIFEDMGEGKTEEEMLDGILAVIPIKEITRGNPRAEDKLLEVINGIFIKLLKIKERACQNQGRCDECFMTEVCLQILR